MTPIQSLHTHTTLSDGKMTHRELFELAQSLGISVFAYTDHDSVPPPEILAELETFRERETKWILGIEVTADLPKELKPDMGIMHIIGLFIDPTNKAILEHCAYAQKARVQRMKEIVLNLQNLGFKINEDDCFEMSGGESVGRPHIIRALEKYPENNLVTEKIRLEMAAEAERDPLIQKKYTHMMERGEVQYPYTLFLTPDAFRKGYSEYSYMPDLDEAVKIIRGAGGVAVLAHYYTISPKMPLPALERVVKEGRIDGVEVVYGLGQYGTNNEKNIDTQRQALRDLAKKYNVLAIGGSDAHTREDLKYYAMNDWFSGETKGFTENVLSYMKNRDGVQDTEQHIRKFSSLE